ncbi:MAG: two-component sensor histidine kinase, partial [Notoacmeibacter sp.]|nr:two-component sensor histidine kinase [Notoacmeibacter sp.]
NDMQARIAGFDAERMRTLAAVGHDLRTPITSLRIRAEMLDEAEAAPIIRTLDEMTVMAEGLIAYAKGIQDAETVQPVDLTDLLDRLCRERGAAFSGEGRLAVDGKPVALGRVFSNLIDNAIRYGGSATVFLGQRDGEAVVSVSDDGPGIPAERLESMFEPFVRGEESRSAQTGGAGLGLSIARSLVLAHGGSLRLENRTPRGLCATVTLPLRKP